MCQIKELIEIYEPHYFIVVYSIVSRKSFEVARQILEELIDNGFQHLIIIVANKSDLAKSRDYEKW